jgi:hypothetical protein
MAETNKNGGLSQEGGKDLFEQFKHMSIKELATYANAFNIYVSNGSKEAILIGYMDLGQSPERVKVLANGENEYWTDEKAKYVKAEDRNWKSIQSQ